MAENIGVAPLEQGCAILEDHFSLRYQEIQRKVSEIVDPFIDGLVIKPHQLLDVVSRNFIVGIDRDKAMQTRPFQIARRTFAVSNLVFCVALDHEPSYAITEVFETHINTGQPIEQNYADLSNKLSETYRNSRGFGSIMRECQPSIDPGANEPEIVTLIAGLALQSAAISEANRVRFELNRAANEFSSFAGDLWEVFDQ